MKPDSSSLYLNPTIIEVDTNNIVDNLDELKLIGIRVFDNLEYAKEFCKGKFLTRAISFYSDELPETDPRQDSGEGFFEQLIEIDLNKPSQTIPSIFNINELTFFTDIAKKNNVDLKDKVLLIRRKTDMQVLCMYAWPSSKISSSFDKLVVEDMLKKGSFAVVYKVSDLAKNIIESCPDFLCCGPVLYMDGWSKHPFIKSSKYKQDHEFRFLFRTKEAQSSRQINALPWYKLFDIKSGKVIDHSNDTGTFDE